ncbi:MAG: hypothetical protein REI94_05095 [Moraxellaceae bacterium]|nr:hypothetical protein [Moraxellaceae bacterium]
MKYAPDVHIVGSARTSCNLESYASRVFSERIRASHPDSDELADSADISSADGKVLRISITSVSGLGGGGWSGTKSVTIRADLFERGKLIGMRSFARSTRSMMGAVSGTCPMLETCLDTLSKDLVAWLSRPLGPAPAAPAADEPAGTAQSAPAAG